MEEAGNTYFYHNEHLGTPQKMTDSSGAVAWSAQYTVFGFAHIDAASSVENNLRFPGQYFDAETGLHYNFHRYYDPGTGRYITSDPIGLRGGINLYTYAKDNTMKYIDVKGLDTCIECHQKDPNRCVECHNQDPNNMKGWEEFFKRQKELEKLADKLDKDGCVHAAKCTVIYNKKKSQCFLDFDDGTQEGDLKTLQCSMNALVEWERCLSRAK